MARSQARRSDEPTTIEDEAFGYTDDDDIPPRRRGRLREVGPRPPRPSAREAALGLVDSLARVMRAATIALGVLCMGLMGFALTQSVPLGVVVGAVSALSVWWARFS